MKYYLYFSRQYGSGKMTWYFDLIESNESTTAFVRERFKNAKFEVVRQYECDDTIIRESRFVLDGKTLVTSTVVISMDNPPGFLQLIHDKEEPIGDIIKEKGFRVERYVVSRDRSSKYYIIKGDAQMEVYEEYFG
ncbi:MAG: hypothetical protein QMD78_05995 [Methanocellales archaeon]|nr:hypothetical protein [Methanocellales archaeon]